MLAIALLSLSLAPQDPAPAPITVALTPAATGKGLRWSPKGATVPLTLQDGALVGSFALGHKGTPPVAVRLQKREGAGHFDLLWLDVDRNGVLGDADSKQATPKEQRGKWWSSFEAEIAVPLADAKGMRQYPLNLWYVEDPQEPDAKPALRWSRRGWCEGQTEIGGKPAFVLITEMHMDGVFDQRDAWAIGRTRDEMLAASSRSLEQHVWLDGVAFRATAIDADGRSLTFGPFDPGITEAEEKAKADIYAADRNAERAAKPVPFGVDFAAALASAKQGQKRVFVDFQTTWCGPCKQMQQWVYTAKAVVDAASSCVPVVQDGDEQRALVKQYQVTAYPTMLLLDADGVELRRAVGYRSVADMVKFLRADPPR